MSHDSYVYETCSLHIWDMTRISMRHDSSSRWHAIWSLHTWHIAHTYIWHVTHTSIWDVTHISIRHNSSSRWYASWHSFIFETLIIYIYMRRDSYIYEPWPIRIWDMFLTHMRHDSYIYETWLIITTIRDLTPSNVTHIAHTCISHAYICICMSHFFYIFLYIYKYINI